MKGLILKDFLMLKKQMMPGLLFILLYGVITLLSHDSNLLTGFIIILCTMLPVNALSLDDRAGFPKYALTMPVSRNTLVISKYVLGLILIGAGNILALTANRLVGQSSWLESLWIITLTMVIGCLLLSLSLPTFFKFGHEKGRIVLLCLMLPLGFLGGFVAMASTNGSITTTGSGRILGIHTDAFFYSPWTLVCLLAVGALSLLLSMGLSLLIYRNKDF
ncbi:ABC-2 transporter permease [Aminipila butyrica]|uniref:ABC-2 transporter permease n=1 Tax=Aminipila butyrica TaxID=433296 RepID=A0A858BRL4_9FIRM|nr:ABC-2 transporter permease [Aminipila butyrica]QIB67829.1 ABC-2 transporter permease [Aminipila butyrica]